MFSFCLLISLSDSANSFYKYAIWIWKEQFICYIWKMHIWTLEDIHIHNFKETHNRPGLKMQILSISLNNLKYIDNVHYRYLNPSWQKEKILFDGNHPCTKVQTACKWIHKDKIILQCIFQFCELRFFHFRLNRNKSLNISCSRIII